MSPWENFFSSRRARSRSPIIIRALFHKVIVAASGKRKSFVKIRNRKTMVNVTNSGTLRSAETVDEHDSLTPAEKQKELVRRAQAGDVSAYEDLVRMHQHRVLAVVG